jgi:hypothetical protein
MTMIQKLNTANGLQRRTDRTPAGTAVWHNGGSSASYDSFVAGSSVVLGLNFSAKNPPLCQAANSFLNYYSYICEQKNEKYDKCY